MTATDIRERRYRVNEPTGRGDVERPRPASAAATEAAAATPATEVWWDSLGDAARETARRVARCGGYLPAELAHPLVQAGVPMLMPDDVRRYIQHHTTT